MSHPERGYRALFERAPVALWDVDLARLSAACRALESSGAPVDAQDWAGYLEAHADARRALAAAIAVRDANEPARALAGSTQAADVAALLEHVPAGAAAVLLAALVAQQPALETETTWQVGDTRRRVRLTYRRLTDGADGDAGDDAAAPLRGMIGVIELPPEPAPSGSGHDATHAELAQALAAAREELARFAYVASHDLQAPLRTVIGYTDLLQRRYGQVLDEKAQKYIEYAADGARQMRSMIEGLLALSRVLTRQREMGTVELSEVLDEVLDRLRKRIAEAGAQVTHDALPAVTGDRTQLVQAFEHIIDNALKFHGAEPPVIHVSARRESDTWTLSVSDNGLGIPANRLAAIFDPFHRLHPVHEYPGSGLGLAIVAKIAERHRGRAWAESQGQGATFFLTFPDTRPDPPPSSTP